MRKRTKSSQTAPTTGTREVVFSSGDPQFQLQGTLTLPEGSGPFPAAVLVTGSGAHNRDEELFGKRPFREIAEWFRTVGIAVLRYDDRHYKRPSREGAQYTSEDFTRDALGALDYLRSCPEVDPDMAGIIGHSEGGIIAARAAALTAGEDTSRDAVSFVISLAGSGVTGAEIIADQTRSLYSQDARSIEFMQRWLKAMVPEPDAGRRSRLYMQLFHEVYGWRYPLKWLTARVSLPVLVGPWYYHFCCTDPAGFWRQVACPVLILLGEHDVQVRPELNQTALEAALQAAPTTDFTVRIVPKANHLFQLVTHQVTTVRELRKQYAHGDTAIDPQVLTIMADWIKEHQGE